MLKKLLRNLLQNRNRLFLLLIGTLSWSITMVKSGVIYRYGAGFWGPNGHDGIWHIALSESLAKGSWQMPVFAGESIQNYHIGFDLILAALHKLTFIPISILYFQILPPIFAFVLGYLVYEFVYYWRKSDKQAFWATFFTYFGGSFGWIVTLIRDGKFGGESLFWAQQSVSTLINPPFALSLIFLFTGLILMSRGVDKENKSFLVTATFLFGILIQIKVYAGLLVLAGLIVAGFWQLIAKRSAGIIKVFVGVLIISVLLFSEVAKGIGSQVIYRPFWFLEQMMSTPDRFYWPKFASAMLNYRLAGNIPKGIAAYSLAFLIFLFGNLGSRFLGFLWYWQKGIRVKAYQYTDLLILTIIISGIVIPTFFTQSGTAWNTIQFMYFSLLFLGILSGVWLGEILEKLNIGGFLKTIIVFITVTLTLPTTAATLVYNYLPGRPPAKVSKSELEALTFLKSQPQGVVLTGPFDRDLAGDAISNPPRPLYLYESTAYVSAYSEKQTYLEDEVNLDITGYDWKGRREKVDRFFTDPTYDGKYELMDKEGISYVYVVKSLRQGYKDLHLDPGRIFENDEIVIYKN